MSNWAVRTILDAANNRNKKLISQMANGVLDANKGQTIFPKNLQGRLINVPREPFVNGAGPVNNIGLRDIGRVAAQLGYGKAMDGARYAGQIVKDHPGVVAVGGLGVGTGLYAMGLTPDPFGQREKVANAFEQANQSYMWPYNQDRELSDEEILEMQMMGML